MKLDTAIGLLSECIKDTDYDEMFEETEFYWLLNGEKVANGYLSDKECKVWVQGNKFVGEVAKTLLAYGKEGKSNKVVYLCDEDSLKLNGLTSRQER